MSETKNYWNDSRVMPLPVIFGCPDCRNTIRIEILQRYPHGPDNVFYCPVCRCAVDR